MRNQCCQYMMRGYLFARVVSIILVASEMLYAGEIAPKSEVASPPATMETDPTGRLQEVGRKLSQIGPVIDVVQQKLPFLIDRINAFDNAKFREKLTKLSESYAALQTKLKQLEQEMNELRQIHESKQKNAPQCTAAELEQKVREAEKKKKALENKLSVIQRESSQRSKEPSGPPELVPLHQHPKLVLLYNGRVAPVNAPYYSFANRGYIRLKGRNIPATKVKRIKEGEPIDKAIKAGGCLDQLLSKLDPDKEYVSLLVCRESIVAFRTVVEHLRNRKINYAWRPEEDREFVLTSASSAEPEGGHNVRK